MSKRRIRVPIARTRGALWSAFLLAAALIAPLAGGQAPSRFVGTISAIGGDSLTIKSDQGQSYQVEVPATAALRRIAPGQRDLSTAQQIQFSGLAIGDRALVRLDPGAPAGTLEALQIVAVKQEDVAMKQQMEREDWQRRGAGGLVKSVDAASGFIVLTSGAGALAKTIAVHTTPATMFKRYAPGSVRFDEAQPAPIGAIRVGDQLRARGEKSADGTEISADEVISGSFRNISGVIVSVDPAGLTLVVKDLATKKTVTVRIRADSEMRRLPERMAQMLAAILKGTVPSGVHGQGAGRGELESVGGQGRAWNRPGTGSDLQQVLNRAPAIQLDDLKKGEAVMLVATEGANEVEAVTLLAGVEPLLESPEASRDLLSNWSMESGAGSSETAQ
jgi:outer membrane lipoprotein SlyB